MQHSSTSFRFKWSNERKQFTPFDKQLSKSLCTMWLLVFSLLTVVVRCTYAEVCFCTKNSTSSAVYAQRELHSDVIGYVGNGDCFYGDYANGDDWVTVNGRKMVILR